MSRAQSEQQLRQIEQDAAAATKQGHWQFFERLFAPDWTLIDMFGVQHDKIEALNTMKSGEAKPRSILFYDVQVRFLKDDVALVTGRVKATGAVRGKTIPVLYRFTEVYVQQGGRWLCEATQATFIRGM